MEKEYVLIDLDRVINSVRANFRKSVIISMIILIGAAPLLFLLPNKYSSKVTILPSAQGGGLSDLGAVAGLIGVNIPEFSGQETNDILIPDIIKSERLLSSLIDNKWKYNEYDSLVSLYTIFSVEPPTRSVNPEREKRELMLEMLRKDLIGVGIDKETGLITISFTAPGDPIFAQTLLDSLIFQLDRYNRQFRKTKSTAEFTFLEKRLSEVLADLTYAENELARFETDNKNWQLSPGLQSKWKKLNREVTVNSTLWAELRKQYELVKINIEKEKQTIDVLDMPSLPGKKSGPKRLYMLVGIGIFSFSFLQLVFYFNLYSRFLGIFRFLKK